MPFENSSYNSPEVTLLKTKEEKALEVIEKPEKIAATLSAIDKLKTTDGKHTAESAEATMLYRLALMQKKDSSDAGGFSPAHFESRDPRTGGKSPITVAEVFAEADTRGLNALPDMQLEGLQLNINGTELKFSYSDSITDSQGDEYGAPPGGVLVVEGNMSVAEAEKVREFFGSLTEGIDYPIVIKDTSGEEPKVIHRSANAQRTVRSLDTHGGYLDAYDQAQKFHPNNNSDHILSRQIRNAERAREMTKLNEAWNNMPKLPNQLG